MNADVILGGVFAAVILVFLAVDLGFLNRRAHAVSFRSALIQSVFWIAISLAFAALLFFLENRDAAYQFLSAYLTEKILSVDNLFVILLVFTHFGVEEKYHHRVLFWGILGAIVLRALFIGFGSYLVGSFHWILYIFGIILVWSGIKLLFKKKEKEVDFGKTRTVRFLHRFLPISTAPHHGKFLHIENGRRMFTTLFIALILVEITDVIFAVDSIPAAFAITTRTFLIYTSNIFAIMGLRAMFFLLEDVVHRMKYLAHALAFILVFIGGKMLAEPLGVKISSATSFVVILTALAAAAAFGLLQAKLERGKARG